MMDVDKLIDNAEAYGEGMKQGKEMAIKNYDKLFLELYQKMQDIEDKLDSFISGLEKFTTRKKVANSTQDAPHSQDKLDNTDFSPQGVIGQATSTPAIDGSALKKPKRVPDTIHSKLKDSDKEMENAFYHTDAKTNRSEPNGK